MAQVGWRGSGAFRGGWGQVTRRVLTATLTLSDILGSHAIRFALAKYSYV